MFVDESLPRMNGSAERRARLVGTNGRRSEEKDLTAHIAIYKTTSYKIWLQREIRFASPGILFIVMCPKRIVDR